MSKHVKNRKIRSLIADLSLLLVALMWVVDLLQLKMH